MQPPVDMVRRAIDRAGPRDDRAFVRLARAVAASQGHLGRGRGLDGIRPVPEVAFKLEADGVPRPPRPAAIFRTSGTTTGVPGTHAVEDLDLYRRSVVAGFERFVMYPPRPGALVSLVPPSSDRPESSLSWMATIVASAMGATRDAFIRRDHTLDLDSARSVLAGSAAATRPVVLFGTSLDFLTLIDAVTAAGSPPFPLPPGSRAMHTGGVKASGRELDRLELRDALARTFSIAPGDVVEEYGMTELLSQAYDSPAVTPGPRRLVGVPWMRSRVLDPVTLHDVAPGDRGILCHYDLANCLSAVAVLTSDLATRVADGFTDVRRAPGSAARGCSAEAATAAMGRLDRT